MQTSGNCSTLNNARERRMFVTLLILGALPLIVLLGYLLISSAV